MKDLLNSMSLSMKMMAGVVSISLLGAIIGIVGLVSISSIDSVLNEITDSAAPTVETASDLVANIWEATKVAEEIIADEELEDVRELAVELEKLNAAFNGYYRELEELVVDPDLLDEMRNVLSEHQEFVEHSSQMIEAHITELEEEITANQQLVEFDNIGGQLIIMLDEFANENEAEMQRAEDQGDRLEASGSATAAQVNKVLGDLFDTDYPVVEAALKMQRLVIEMQDTAGEYLAAETLEELPAISENFAELALKVRPHLETLKRLAESDEDKEDAARLEAAFENWYSTADDDERLFDTHKDMLTAEFAADNFTETFESDADNVAAALNAVVDKADAFSDGADENAAAKVLTAQIITLIFIVILAVIATLVIWVVRKQVSAPILEMNNAMRLLADGDTSITVPALGRNDEVGDMAEAVEVFKNNAIEREKLQAEQRINEEKAREREDKERLAEQERAELEAQREREAVEARRQEMLDLADQFEQAVLGVVDEVARSVDEMSKAAVEMSAIAEQTSERSGNVTKVAEEASNNVSMVASASEELSSSINELEQQASNANDVSTSAVERTTSAGNDVGSLVESSSQISNVVSLINDIAEQTNLLALNATIEAARAGEAGRGFAVVASEVKSLASQTAQATEDIAKQVNSMQEVAGRARGGMDEVQKAIESVSSIIANMSSAITQQSASTQEIARSAQDVSRGTTEVTRNITLVNEGASTTGAASTEVITNLQTVSQLTQEVRSQAIKFIEHIRK